MVNHMLYLDKPSSTNWFSEIKVRDISIWGAFDKESALHDTV